MTSLTAMANLVPLLGEESAYLALYRARRGSRRTVRGSRRAGTGSR